MQIPAALRTVNNWLVWKKTFIQGEKKPRKVPFYVSGVPRNGAQGSPQDRASLSSYAAAIKAMEGGGRRDRQSVAEKFFEMQQTFKELF